MEPLSIHTMDLNGFGDVAIIDFVKSGTAIFKKTTRTPVAGAKRMTTIEFNEGGTGFLVSQREILIKGRPKKFALVLTAAHVVFDVMSNTEKSSKFRCLLENNRTRALHLVKVFLDLSNDSYRSNITNFCYCTSGDTALLLMKLKLSDRVEHYNITTRIQSDALCFVSGYPKKRQDLSYAVPQLEGQTKSLIKAKANEIFCNFSTLVYSEGSVVSNENGLVEISCSTTNGMSGSPIVSNSEAIGVYVGGPPLPGQKEILSVVKKIKQGGDITQIITEIQEIARFQDHYRPLAFHRIQGSSKFKVIEILNKINKGEAITEPEQTLYHEFINDSIMLVSTIHDELMTIKNTLLAIFDMLVHCFKKKDLFQANAGVSSSSDVFQQVSERIERFRTIEEASSTASN